MYSLQGNHFSKEDAYFALRDQKLLTLTIMLENICNFKCPFCYTQTRNFENELNTNEIMLMIDDAVKLGVKSILIAGAGEPLLAKNFWEIVQHINQRGLFCIVFSNMTRIDKKVAADLYNLNVSIIGKINSFDEARQNKIVGGIPNAYALMQRGLANLIEAGFNTIRNGTTRLAIETSVVPDNIDEIFEIWTYCRQNNIYPLVDTVLYEGGAKKYGYDDFLVSYDDLSDVVKKINQYDRKAGMVWPVKIVRRENNKGIIVGELAGDCHRIGTNLNVNSIGDVYDCFNMSMPPYGNIREKSLSKIFEDDTPYKNAIDVHGLCHCRYLTDRKCITKEIAAAL